MVADGAEFDAVGLVGFVAEQAAAFFVIRLIVAFEPGDFAVAFKGEDVCGDSIDRQH